MAILFRVNINSNMIHSATLKFACKAVIIKQLLNNSMLGEIKNKGE